MNIEQIIKEKKGCIVDVRTPEEFRGGHVAGSINIPLPEINSKIEVLQAMHGPLILCCASGGRSGMAHSFLSRLGVECYNGGSWMDVNYLQTLTTDTK